MVAPGYRAMHASLLAAILLALCGADGPAADAGLADGTYASRLRTWRREAARYELARSRLTAAARTVKAAAARSNPRDVLTGSLPPPASVRCHTLSSVSEVCAYENVCVNLPRPDGDAGNEDQRDSDRLLLLLGHGKERYPARLDDPPGIVALRDAARAARRAVRPGGAPLDAALLYSDSWDLRFAQSTNGGTQAVPEAIHGVGSHLLPYNMLRFGFGLAPGVDAKAGLPAELGGSWPGGVTWVDNLWLVEGLTGPNPAEVASSIEGPLILAAHLNATLGLNLPPLDNLYIDSAFRWMLRFSSENKDSVGGFGPMFASKLAGVLRYVRHAAAAAAARDGVGIPVSAEAGPEYDPFYGRHAADTQWPHLHALGPYLEALLPRCCPQLAAKAAHRDAASIAECVAGLGACQGIRYDAAPYGTLLNSHNRAGTRLIRVDMDVPRPPNVTALLASGGAAAPWVGELGPRHRLCARRAAIAGRTVNYLPGAEAERAVLRQYLAATYGVKSDRPACKLEAAVEAAGEAAAVAPEAATVAEAGVADVPRASALRGGSAGVAPADAAVAPLAPPAVPAAAAPSPAAPASSSRSATACRPPAPPTVLVLNRVHDDGFTGRHFENIEGVVGLLAKYKLPYRVLNETQLTALPLAGQLQLHGDADIAIVPHGAHQVWSTALPRGGVVIEVQPRGMWCAAFIRANGGSDLTHLLIHSQLKPEMSKWPPGDATDAERVRRATLYDACDGQSYLAIALDTGPCWGGMRGMEIRVPLPELEVALLRALAAVDTPRTRGTCGGGAGKAATLPSPGPDTLLGLETSAAAELCPVASHACVLK